MVGNVQASQVPASGQEHVAPVRLVWQEDSPGLRGMPPQGLRNLGNTCYLNSVLQCLTYTPPLANYCLLSSHSSLCEAVNSANSGSCAFCFLERRINRSLTMEAAVDAPVKINNRLRIFASHFRGGRQEDAHEFLRYAIEACNNSCIQLLKAAALGGKGVGKQRDGSAGKEEPHTVIKEIFGGVLQSQVKCLSCEGESNKRDEIMDLSLDVNRLSSVKEALCSFFQPEVLDADNKYRCGNCKKLSTARKQMSIFRAPNVLVIQFKRFENFFGGKIDRHIQFEERLSLAGHMCKASKDARPDYSLYGVIIHAGHTQGSGHYYAYVKDSGGRWYCCNDSSVNAVSIQSVLADKAYILFYVRTNGALKKVPTSSCAAGKPVSQASDGDGAQSQKSLLQESSLSSVKLNGCGNKSDDRSTVSSMPKTQLHFLGPRRADADRLRAVKVDTSSARQCSDKVVLPRTPDNQSASERLSPGGRLSNGGSEAVLVASSAVERDSLDSTVTSDTVSQPSSKGQPDVGDVCTGAASLLDLAAAATSPSMNNSSSSSNQFIGTADPASGCTGSSSGDNRVAMDNREQKGGSVKCEASEGVENTLKRSRLENTQSQGSDSGTSVFLSTVTDPRKGAEDGDEQRRTAILDALKRRLEDEGREKLRHSDWCDALRKELRAAKRRRLANQACCSHEDKLLFRKQIVDDVHDAMIGYVPNALKENMVEDLQKFFRRKAT